MPSTPPRVLLATPYDLSVPGGVNRQPLGLLRELPRLGFEVLLVGPCTGPPPGDRIVSLGSTSRYHLNDSAPRLTFDPRVLPQLYQTIQDFAPDVVHVQEPVIPIPSAAALWMAPRGARRVGTFHTYSERSRGYLWAWPWVRLVWSRLHARVAVSEAAREFATRYHQANFRILPNAVDVPLTPSPAPGGPGPLRVLFVGRLDDRRKGFGVLVEALQRLEARAPDTVVVTAVGPGTRTWEPRIPPALPLTLRGQVADDELAAAYRACDLVVVPSLGGESFGLVPLEAMAQQRPVVASRIPGYAAWLDGATRLVEPGDPEALAVALAELAVDEPTRAALARKGRAVAEEYAWPAQAERWAELYRSG